MDIESRKLEALIHKEIATYARNHTEPSEQVMILVGVLGMINKLERESLEEMFQGMAKQEITFEGDDHDFV
jgi:hypothetical protein